MLLSQFDDPKLSLQRAASSAMVLGVTLAVLGIALLVIGFQQGAVWNGTRAAQMRWTATLAVSDVYLLLGPGVAYIFASRSIRLGRRQGTVIAAWTVAGQMLGVLAVVGAWFAGLVTRGNEMMVVPAWVDVFLVPAAIAFAVQAALAIRAIRLMPPEGHAFEPVMVTPMESATNVSVSSNPPSDREADERDAGDAAGGVSL